jgi:hypothetical protein
VIVIGVTFPTWFNQGEECFVIVLFIQIFTLKVWYMRLGVHNMYLFEKLFTFANIFPNDAKLGKKIHMYSIRWVLFFRLWYVMSFMYAVYNKVTIFEALAGRLERIQFPLHLLLYTANYYCCNFGIYFSTNITFQCEPHGICTE